MPDRIFVEIFTLKSFALIEDISLDLDILESSSNLSPTHWGKDERPSSRRKYVRDEVSFFLEERKPDGLHFYRNQHPIYTFFYSSRYSSRPGGIHWSFEKNVKTLNSDIVKEIFDASSSLAEALEAVFGYIWTPWDDNDGYKRYMPRPFINIPTLLSYGPNPVDIRTWYGPYIIGLIGRNVLTESGVLTRDTAWGGVELDLVEEPWNSSLEEVLKRQKEVMAVLGKTEVFGNYTKYPICKPGKRWIPFS